MKEISNFTTISFSEKSKQILNIQAKQPHAGEGTVGDQKQRLFKI